MRTGTRLEVDVELGDIPLFVREGGGGGVGTLDGETMRYRDGEFSRRRVTWSDTERVLTMHPDEGNSRVFAQAIRATAVDGGTVHSRQAGPSGPMTLRELAHHDLGDMSVRYVTDGAGQIGLTLAPGTMATVTPRDGIGAEPYIRSLTGAGDPPAREIDPLVHIALRGDNASGGFSQGRTMRWSPSNARFSFDDQQVSVDDSTTRIATTLRSREGLRLTHVLTYREGDVHLAIHSEFANDSAEPVTLDAISSFAMSGISPFDPTDSANRLTVHRLRSAWSAEARPVAETIEDLHLERSWLGIARLSERFGQVGTMPTRGWFPFVAIEDTEAGVTWGTQLAWAGSWQLEVARLGDDVALSGGLADREFGHWSHTVLPGARLVTPTAIVSCTIGSVDDLTDRLVSAQVDAAETQPQVEASLPVVFNEWCTTWGNPERERLTSIADRLTGAGIEYLVIDAGWYRGTSTDASWAESHGDWVPNPQSLSERAQ